MMMIRPEEDTTPGILAIPRTTVAGITVMMIVEGTIVEGTIVVGAAAKKRNLLGRKSRPSTRRKNLCHAWLPLAPKVGLKSSINHLLPVVPALAACLARQVVQTY